MDPGYRFGGKLMIDTWQWWDGIEIPKDITPVTSAHIDETSKSKLQQIQQHNQLAQRDQDAITGLVAYVEHMACARATTTKDSALNAEVAKTLNALVYALQSNSTQLQNSSMAECPDQSFDVRAVVHLEISKTKDQQVDANNTLEPHISSPSKRQRSFTVSGSSGPMNKRVCSSPFRNSAISDDEDIVV